MAQGEKILMSESALDRLDIIKRVCAKELCREEAAHQLGVGARQVKRLVSRYRTEGGLSMAHRHKGGNRAFSDEFKQHVMACVQAHYKDFGPSFAAEKLKERNGLEVNRETLRQWMQEAGLRTNKAVRQTQLHPSRARRSCYGELVQIDGSYHDWFEGRAPSCTLLVFIDDATSRLMQMRFEPTETTLGYFRAFKDYALCHGLPVTFYSDKAAIFTVNTPSKHSDKTPISQFGRAMKHFNVEIILANSPQAKGRVERANRTLQDRLIKEMRLRNICSIEAANRYLPEFTLAHNAQFAVVPAKDRDAHRPLTEEQSSELIQVLAYQDTRKLSKNLEFSYHNSLYQVTRIGKQNQTGKLRRTIVTVCECMDGTITVMLKGKILAYTTLTKQRKHEHSADSKALNSVVDSILEQQQGKAA